MNILPLVSAFILIFAIGSYTFVHNLLASMQEKEHFQGAMKISHAYGRKHQTKHWRKIKGKNLLKSSKSSNETPKETKYISPRSKLHPCLEAKLNVHPLTKQANPKLEKIFLDLIDELYALSPFNSKEIGPLLLNLIKQEKRLSSLHELIGLAPEENRDLLYKILKGTQIYNTETTEGYPALTDYVKIDVAKKKSINFCHASRPLLNVLFGYPIAGKIRGDEERKWEPKHKHDPLSKTELEPLLLSYGFNLSNVEELLEFVKKKAPLKEEVMSQQKIQVRQKF